MRVAAAVANLAPRLRAVQRDIIALAAVLLSLGIAALVCGAPPGPVAWVLLFVGVTFGAIRHYEVRSLEAQEPTQGAPTIAWYVAKLRDRYEALEAQRRIAQDLGISLARFRSWPATLRPSEKTIQRLAFHLRVDGDLIRQAAGRLPIRELSLLARQDKDVATLLWRLPRLPAHQRAELMRMAD